MDETSPLIGHFCRAPANETLPTVVVPGFNAWVRMVLVPHPPMSGFQMRYTRTGRSICCSCCQYLLVL